MQIENLYNNNETMKIQIVRKYVRLNIIMAVIHLYLEKEEAKLI